MTLTPPGDQLSGPDELARAILDVRRSMKEESRHFGDISEAGVRRILRIAYHASQVPNEGRYPRMTFLVPAEKQVPTPLASFTGPLTVPSLRRLGPVLSSPRFALVVRECGADLTMTGLTSLEETFEEEPLFPTASPCRGLRVEINGPGDLRAGEWARHRLFAGSLYQEMPYLCAEWFAEWSDEAAATLLGEQGAGLIVGGFWQYLARKVIRRRHGGCLAVLPNPSAAPIRHAFAPSGCDLGAALAAYHGSRRAPAEGQGAHLRARLESFRRLHSVIEALVQFSATDGCVVFDRGLNLYSFGSMIEAEGGTPPVPCYRGDSETPLDEGTLRTFGARRRSAIQLCRACPGALAFVISQDGDFRAVVRRGDAVHLHEDLPFW